MQNWESMQQANYEHNWYGGVFPTIKREPSTQSYTMDQHHQKSNPMDTYNSPSSTPRTEGLDSHSFYENQIYNGLNNIHHPLGFNPLTPPGYPNAVMPQLSFGQDSLQEAVSSATATSHNHKQTDISQSLTPSHTPPMDVTPPKSPKSLLGTPEKDHELSSNSNDSGEDTRFLEIDNDNNDYDKPKYNSHGKPKEFKCKQCEYVTKIKADFWKHARDHIKPEKLLECHFCPFVTELKHHLEYHIRKHKNSKPFKCDKCSYSCVNKSMLNSHLKSHSTVYQYRCANCDYATKYCHSFKLHLRKYTHQPGVVLNEDGTPNPMVIIDVYGTRRGPKMKSSSGREGRSSSKSTRQELRNTNPPTQSTTVTQPRVPPVMNSHPSSGMMSNLLPNTLANMLQQSGNLPFFPYLNLNLQMLAAQQQAVLAQLSPNLGGELQSWDNDNQNEDKTIHYDSETEDFDCNSISHSAMDLSQASPVKATPLPESSSSAQSNPLRVPVQQSVTATPLISTSKTHRRKGRAFKLDAINNSDDETPTVLHAKLTLGDFEENRQTRSPDCLATANNQEDTKPNITTSERTATMSTNEDTPRISPRDTYECKYCGIYFRDAVLHTIHMGYHSCDDEFKCNMCGEKCGDRLTFFVHIARFPHS